MKKIILLSLFLLMLASVSAIVVNIYPREMRTGANEVTVIVMNHQKSIKDASIRVAVPEFDAKDQMKADLKKDKSAKAYMEMEIPDDAKGYYPVRITVADKKGVIKRTHTWVLIE